jgi:hypothetical protein
MSAKDKNVDPAKAILQIYDSLSAVYKSTKYMEETEEIYSKAKKYILKRAIYVANYYKKKGEFSSALARLKNTEKMIPSLIRSSSEAQYLIVLSEIKTLKDVDKLTLFNNYKIKFPGSEFIEELENQI